MKLKPKTIDMMRRVIEAILAEPEYFDQNHFPAQGDTCQTPCCGAGWVVWCANPDLYIQSLSIFDMGDQWVRLAEKILEVNTGDALFWHPCQWPYKFWKEWSYDNSSLEKARLVAARWEHYIATDGRE